MKILLTLLVCAMGATLMHAEEQKQNHEQESRAKAAETARKEHEEKKRKKEMWRKRQEKHPREHVLVDEIAHKSPHCATTPWQSTNGTENFYNKRESIRDKDWQQPEHFNDHSCDPMQINQVWR